MKSSTSSSKMVSLLVILITFSSLNTHPTVFAKHKKAGGTGDPEPVRPLPIVGDPEPVPPLPIVGDPEPIPPLPIVLPQPVVQPEPVVPPLPVVLPEPVVPPLPVVPPEPVVPPQDPARPRLDTTYEIHIINQASAGADTVNVNCTPGGPPPGPPGLPPQPACGPPVPPHILKVGERFSWVFEYPDASADISYLCRVDWSGHNQGLVSLFDKDSYTDAICKGDNGNNCYWTIAPDGFYLSRDDAPFPGPAWTFRWPWGL